MVLAMSGAGNEKKCLVAGAVGAACAVFAVAIWGFTPHACVAFAFTVALVGISVVDARTKTISNQAVLAVAAIGLASLAWPLANVSLANRLVGVFAVSLPLLGLAAATGGFGGGDVKLMAAIGFTLGWQLAIFTFAAAVVAGGCYAGFLLAFRKAARGDAIAFGPFICAGAVIAAAWGEAMMRGLFGC